MYPEYEETQVRPSDMNYAMKTALGFFLEQRHYQKLQTVLAEQWQGGCHSLGAALQLIKAHGQVIAPEEEQRLIELSQRSEEAMIEALVDLMPRDKPDQFEHFFLQLSFIASTTTRLRTALEAGHPELVEEALESAENVGVLPYLLKMAVAQAGLEVQTLDKEHDSWIDGTLNKMGPLLTASIEAMAIQQELTQVNSTISHFQLETREKTRSVIAAMIEGNDRNIVTQAFQSYKEYVHRQRREDEITKEYEEELTRVQQEILAFKESSLRHAKGVIQCQLDASRESLVAKCFYAFVQLVTTNKDMFRLNEEEKKLKTQADAFAQKNSASAKSLMNRIAEHSTQGALALAFKALAQNMAQEKQDREVGKELAAAKGRFAEMEKKQKAFGKSMLTSAICQGDEQLRQTVFSNWKDLTREEKLAEEQTTALAAKTSMVKDLTGRAKESAMQAGCTLAELEDQQMLIYVLQFWKRESRISTLRRLGKEKNEKRKKELVDVKGLFKSFATDLETNLTRGTPRVESPKPLRAGPRAD
eukprot:CAMPEP_0176066478 /NCGR_PEP_ID=MMETSP0120_2-20121206/33175_1 /TAXON_ID=160619 /ORGANISM="Kryptoperidinium foliaceum, Strain CCMP 1326" /LENGTH=530 /DNA_ID=CAMNT_0017400083 /DNA_START=105 /DNA_END=1697 /DNA_ORIENTATION=+